MKQAPEVTNLETMLDRLGNGTDGHERISIGRMTEVVGRRSFGPLLLVAGLIALSPLSGIPGMPTMVAILVILIAAQLLCGRERFWLPNFLLRRSVSRERFQKALRFMRPPARFVDRFLRPRLTGLTHTIGSYGVAFFCILIALTMPPLEILPFAASTAGAALSAFGLSLIAHDGLLAIIALLFTAGTFGFAIYGLLSTSSQFFS